MSIAKTILDQLGGNRFSAMTGATEYVYLEDGVRMKLPVRMTKNKIGFLTIRLRNDLYDIETFKYRKLEMHSVEKIEGVGVEQLRETFERMTGLLTRF